MLNEAGLYWRAVGNSTFAVTCLQKAFNLAPHDYQDIPLVNLANLLIHYGLHLDASRLLLQALAINASEVRRCFFVLVQQWVPFHYLVRYMLCNCDDLPEVCWLASSLWFERSVNFHLHSCSNQLVLVTENIHIWNIMLLYRWQVLVSKNLHHQWLKGIQSWCFGNSVTLKRDYDGVVLPWFEKKKETL